MRYLIALACFSLSGCSTEAALVNEKGEKRFCYKESSGAIGSGAAATREFNRCLNDAGTAGFRKVQ